MILKITLNRKTSPAQVKEQTYRDGLFLCESLDREANCRLFCGFRSEGLDGGLPADECPPLVLSLWVSP